MSSPGRYTHVEIAARSRQRPRDAERSCASSSADRRRTAACRRVRHAGEGRLGRVARALPDRRPRLLQRLGTRRPARSRRPARPPCSSRSTARSVITMPPSARRRPCRPPVDDGRAQARVLGDFPERFRRGARRGWRSTDASAGRDRWRRGWRGASVPLAGGDGPLDARRRSWSRSRGRRARPAAARWRSSSTPAPDRDGVLRLELRSARPNRLTVPAGAARRDRRRRSPDRSRRWRSAVTESPARRPSAAGDPPPTARRPRSARAEHAAPANASAPPPRSDAPRRRRHWRHTAPACRARRGRRAS